MFKEKEKLSVWEAMESKGYSRAEFLKFCGYAAALCGIAASGLDKVVHALENKKRPPVVWMHFQECTCCSESFIRSSHPIVSEVILDTLSLDYTETLQAAAGHQAEQCLEDTVKKYKGEYIMLCEGSIPVKDDGVYCCVGGKSSLDRVKEISRDAAAVIAWGSCASVGCVQSAGENPTGATPIHKVIGKSVINVPGCPPIADVMTAVVTHILVFGKIPDLDWKGRPKEFYSRRVHDTCYRRPNYDAGLFVQAWDDDGARKGYCLYKMGCRGPVTYNACAVTKWNNGTSFPIQSGHGCIGCSEEGYWDNGPLYKHLGGFPGFGIEQSADSIGIGLAAATGAAVAAHAIRTNIRKRDIIHSEFNETEQED